LDGHRSLQDRPVLGTGGGSLKVRPDELCIYKIFTWF